MDLIIFSGQSNMQGQAEAPGNTDIVPNAYEYRYLEDAIVPLRNPVGENITKTGGKGYPFTEHTDLMQWLGDHVFGAACYGNANLVPAFCRAYSAISGRETLAVHAAKGSTVIAQWLPGTRAYEMLCKKVRAACRKAGGIGRIFFVWLQGESDAIAGNSKEYYKEAIAALHHALQRDLQIDRFCVIRVGRFTNDARDDAIIGAQNEICKEDEKFWMLTDIAEKLNAQPQYMNPGVPGHFGAAGLELLGKTAGKNLARKNG